MRRFIPEVEALRRDVDRALNEIRGRAGSAGRSLRRSYEQVSAVTRADVIAAVRRGGRQTVMLVVAVSLLVPTGLGVVAGGTQGDVVGAHAGESVVAAASAETAASEAWRERAAERGRAAVAERFAREFRLSSDLARQIDTAARRHGIEPEIAFGLVRAESSFRRTVVSHAGAVGLTQLLPSTARWIAPGTTRAALFDAETNLNVGFRYLRYLIDKYNGDVDLALTAYNRGQGRVDRMLRAGQNPDNGYAAMVKTGEASAKLIRQNSPR